MKEKGRSRFKHFSGTQPLLFALLITIVLLLFYIVAAVLAQVFGRSIVSFNLIEAFGRLLGALIFLIIIVRFDWQEKAGLTRFGSLPVWLLTAAVLFYEVATYIYPYLADLDLANVNGVETASVALNALTTGPLEEFPFRGLILYAFVRLWADSKQGLWKAVILSAVFFGASHFIHILFGRPVPRATLIALNAALGGFFYAAVLLRWQTIWPAVALHSGLNSLASIVAFNVPDFSESSESLLVTIAFQIPLLILSVYLISRIETRSQVPKPA